MATEKENTLYSLKCGLSSFLATYVSGILHPLDVIKTRFQSHDGFEAKDNLIPKYKNIRSAMLEIYKSQGFRGLYKGFYVSILSQAVAASFFFWIYQKRKLHYQNQQKNTMIAVLLASTEASVIGTLVTQPLWVLKTKIILNTDSKITEFRYVSKKIKEIWSKEGIQGFNKGLWLSLLLSISGVLQMGFYQGSKILYDKLQIPQSLLNQKNFICGGISKITAVLVTYPITTVRTRIQQDQVFKERKQAKYNGTIDVGLKLWRLEGLKGFYKGLIPNLVRGIPNKGIYFYFYEFFKKIIIGQTNSSKQ